ncbi:hypothetical protein [Weissella paramesenteroides]|uniref:hypothetical protein n=1 Tax=Weissella paramesenteroides TaxID=1249 RepID=UPI003F744759
MSEDIMSKEETLIRYAALTTCLSFLKDHQLTESSKTGQLLTGLTEEIVDSVLEKLNI